MGFANKKGDVGEATRKTKSFKEKLEEQILKMQQIPVSKKILLSGKNDTGKSSFALGVATYDLEPDEIIMYVDVDNSGLEIIHDIYTEYFDNGQIIPYRPNHCFKDEDGYRKKDEEKTIYAIGDIAMDVQDGLDEGAKIKAVVVDGISFILECCEAFMRLEEDISVADGVPMQKWKIRNQAFRGFSSLYMSLPIPVIFISHDDFIPELHESDTSDDFGFSSVKQRFIDECSMRLILDQEEDEEIADYVATIKKNRSDLTTEGNQYTFLTCNKKTKDVDANYEEIAPIIFPKKNKKEKK